MRRYEYIVYDSGKVLGEEKSCLSSGYHVSLKKVKIMKKRISVTLFNLPVGELLVLQCVMAL